MLTLYILPSNAENADIKKTIQCFRSDYLKWIIPCMSWRDINNFARQTAWFGVFYDNEMIDYRAKEELGIAFQNPQFEIIQLYKITNEVTLNSRIFRSDLILRGTFVPLAKHLRYGTILGGWVLEHQEVTNEKRNKGKNRNQRKCN